MFYGDAQRPEEELMKKLTDLGIIFAGLLLGCAVPAGIIFGLNQFKPEQTGTLEPTGGAFVIIFILVIASACYSFKGWVDVSKNKRAWWIGPITGFNFTLFLYLMMGYTLRGFDPAYTMLWITSCLFNGGAIILATMETLHRCLTKPRRRPKQRA